MGQSTIAGIKISGVAAAVPKRKTPLDLSYENFGREDTDKILEAIGIKERRSDPTLCASDLFFAAAESLLKELQWDRSSIDLLVVITQSGDHSSPATACCLHGRLGLKKGCAAFDINLGCSAYPYGLLTVSSMMSATGMKRCLLLVGDMASRDISPYDRSSALLFGDAGTATALELSPDAPPMHHLWGSDGTGWEAIIRRAGGGRYPYTPELDTRTKRENGVYRAETDSYMNGPEVFSFTIREVPGLIRGSLDMAGWSLETTDSFVLHQANLFMLHHLAKKIKIPLDKLPLSIPLFGNTASASIPVTLAQNLPQLRTQSQNVLLAGFGVGLSWAATAVRLGPLVIPPLVEVDSLTGPGASTYTEKSVRLE